MTVRGGTGPVTGQTELGMAGRDLVSVREERKRLAGMLRAAAGFRVDGPDGRVGVLTLLVPDYGDGLPERITIRTGLFLSDSVDIAFGEVVSVDPFSRRVRIRSVPEARRATRRVTARKLRRFLRAGGR